MKGTEEVPFEVALDRAGFGLYSYTLISLTGLVIISFACIAYGTTFIVPTSACELETTVLQQGLLAAAPVVGAIFGALVWGYLGDTRGRRKMLLVSLLSSSLVNALASLSVNWIMLMVLQFFATLLASGKYSLSMTMLSESVPMAKRNLVVLLVTSIFLLSQGIMAVLAMPIIPLTFSYELSALGIYWNSWRTLLVVYSLPSLVSALWLYFLKESPKFIFSKGDEAGAIQILETIHRMNKGKSAENLDVKKLQLEITPTSSDGQKQQVAPLFRMPLLKYTIILAVLFLIQQTGAFIVWLPTIANQFVQIVQTGEGTEMNLCQVIQMSVNAEPASDFVPCSLDNTALLIVLAVCALQSIGNGLVALVVNKAGRRNTVMVVTAVLGACGIVVNLVPNAYGSAALFAMFLLGILVLGLYTAITVALYPTHLRAMAVAVTMMSGRVATFACIQILNYLLVNSCEAGFYIFTALFAASAIVASFLPDDRQLQRPTPPKEKEDNEDVTAL